MSKKVNIIIGLLVVSVLVLICLVYCNNSNFAVFELQEGEAEALGVVFQKGEDLISKYDKYMENKEYEKAIVVAKKMKGYNSLESAYRKLGRYEEALKVNEKLIKTTPSECGYVVTRAIIFEQADKQNEAIQALKKYRKNCPGYAETLILQLEEAMAKGEKLFPVSD